VQGEFCLAPADVQYAEIFVALAKLHVQQNCGDRSVQAALLCAQAKSNAA